MSGRSTQRKGNPAPTRPDRNSVN
uniref:Uncharacterized protein n=1 Tax=Arundo donax TaxID=35708 RepID=A0A0A9BHH9_ARUDO